MGMQGEGVDLHCHLESFGPRSAFQPCHKNMQIVHSGEILHHPKAPPCNLEPPAGDWRTLPPHCDVTHFKSEESESQSWLRTS